MDYLQNSMPRCREFKGPFQLVRMKICLYVIHTIKIHFPIDTLLRKPNSNHYDKVIRQIYWLIRQPLTKTELAEYGFLATFFIYNELDFYLFGIVGK